MKSKYIAGKTRAERLKQYFDSEMSLWMCERNDWQMDTRTEAEWCILGDWHSSFDFETEDEIKFLLGLGWHPTDFDEQWDPKDYGIDWDKVLVECGF